jgi:hypothetical protein
MITWSTSLAMLSTRASFIATRMTLATLSMLVGTSRHYSNSTEYFFVPLIYFLDRSAVIRIGMKNLVLFTIGGNIPHL